MDQLPSVEEIAEYGKTLGIKVSPQEGELFQAAIAKNFAALETFDRLEIEEACPPLKYPDRDSGHRPGPEEDPLNAFLWTCRVPGASQGLLQGKRIGIKDHIAVAGVPLTLGWRFMEGYIPDFDATIVTRVLDAGGAIVGKMNVHSSANLGEFGPVINPHHPKHLSGGSSSAAVAAGYLDIAFAGDQGGSIRIPSSWCGVIGLMPTFGLVPHTGAFGPSDPSIDYLGPIARTVQEIASALEAVAGPDGFDWRQAKVPDQLPRYTQALTEGIDGLRIGILAEGFGFEGSDPYVEETVLNALEVLRRAGARQERVSAPIHGNTALLRLPLQAQGGKHFWETNLGGAFLNTYYPTSLVETMGRRRQDHDLKLPPEKKLGLIVGQYLECRYHGRLYAKAQNVRPTITRQYDEIFSRVDLIALPTVPVTAPPYPEAQTNETSPASSPFQESGVRGNFQPGVSTVLFGFGEGLATRNTAPFALTGHPAITVPCGKLNGLPVGMMLVAPKFREDLLLRTAFTYQNLVDWDGDKN